MSSPDFPYNRELADRWDTLRSAGGLMGYFAGLRSDVLRNEFAPEYDKKYGPAPEIPDGFTVDDVVVIDNGTEHGLILLSVKDPDAVKAGLPQQTAHFVDFEGNTITLEQARHIENTVATARTAMNPDDFLKARARGEQPTYQSITGSASLQTTFRAAHTEQTGSLPPEDSLAQAVQTSIFPGNEQQITTGTVEHIIAAVIKTLSNMGMLKMPINTQDPSTVAKIDDQAVQTAASNLPENTANALNIETLLNNVRQETHKVLNQEAPSNPPTHNTEPEIELSFKPTPTAPA